MEIILNQFNDVVILCFEDIPQNANLNKKKSTGFLSLEKYQQKKQNHAEFDVWGGKHDYHHILFYC